MLYLEIKGLDYMTALPRRIQHCAEEYLWLLGLMKKTDEHGLRHAESAPSQQCEPRYRNGQNEGYYRDEERDKCHAPSNFL